MRRTLRAVVLAGALTVTVASPAMAATPQRNFPVTSANGGDNGLGNCGHNSSGGNPFTSLNPTSVGNGGMLGKVCVSGTGGGGLLK
jgi:Spy/CpxP family protein refolding chaperone